MAAAAVLLGLGVFALVGLESSKVVSASGSLLPEGPAARENGQRSTEQKAPDLNKAPATEPAALRTEQPSPGAELAKPEAATLEKGKLETAKLETATPETKKFDGIAVAPPPAAAENAATPSSAADVSETNSVSELKTGETADRVSLALNQAPKERAQPTPKRAVRRPVVARRRAAPQPAAASKSASNKIDCRQPYWIDEAGIRRLKMACL